MKKNCVILLLFTMLAPATHAQDPDMIAQRKVDSLKKILPAAKGTARVDMLNSISQGLLFIWESDDEFYKEAMKHSDEAFSLAQKLNYKRGTGYALANLFFREASQADTSKAVNDRPGSHFQNAVGIAKKVIRIGEELEDHTLIGTVHNSLSWLYQWHGYKNEFGEETQKAIDHYEQALLKTAAGIYRPLTPLDCESCPGVEFNLAKLYAKKASLTPGFKAEAVQALKTSIQYAEKANAKSYAASTYLQLAFVLAQFNDIRTAVVEAQKALPIFSTQHDIDGLSDSYQALCGYYYELGDLEAGLAYSRKAIQLAESTANAKGPKNEVNYPGDNEFLRQKRLFHGYYWIGRFMTLGGDYESAGIYLKKAAKYNFDNRWQAVWTAAMGNLQRCKGNYDSAFLYLNKHKLSLMRLYNDTKQYEKALQIFSEAIPIATERNNLANLGRLNSEAGRAYYGKMNFLTALDHARKADGYFNIINNNLDRIENYELLSDLYQQVGKTDSAYIFLKRYNKLRDSVMNKQFYIRLNDLKKAAEEDKRTGQINLLQKDVLIKEQLLREQALLKQRSEAQFALLSKDNLITNQVLRLREQQLLLKDQTLKEQKLLREQKEAALSILNKDYKLKDQQLTQQRFLRNALFGGFFLFLALLFLAFRSALLKQKNERLRFEKKQAELQQQSAELEMQALRAQMNPHFIFNCLSSINKYVLKNETRAASDYLTRFSRLIRRVLTNSQLTMIPLSDEIEMLKLYLDMERLRFDNSFEYQIIYANTIEPETIYVPPMLLQPFCENAIWHGLMHLVAPGKLDIVMRYENDHLHCTITDNGIGRTKAAAIKTKTGERQKSLGLKITADRLALLNTQKETESFYRTEDVVDDLGRVSGTRVNLVINCGDAVIQRANQSV